MKPRLLWTTVIANTILNIILAHAANYFCLKCLDLVVGSIQTCPWFCAWTTVIWLYWLYIYIYMIIPILLDFINEESVFCYEVQSPSMWSSPAIGIKPYWSFPEFVERMLPSLRPHVSINSSWKTSRLDAEVLDTAVSFLPLPKTVLNTLFAWVLAEFRVLSIQKLWKLKIILHL